MRLAARIVPLVLSFALLPAAAQAGQDWWEEWAAVFADFFVGPEVKEEFRWKGTVASGRSVEVKGVNGPIVAKAATGGEVEVVALKRGRRHSPAEVRVQVVEHPGGITVCAVYPGHGNECSPGASGRMRVRNSDVKVDFLVLVPSGVGLVARTVNGRVEASGLSGPVVARTVNGSVDVATAGHASAETVNGSIEVTMGAGGNGDLEFETVNGSITVSAPGSLAAVLRASTVNGRLRTDFPLTGEVRSTRRELSGRIGTGGRELRLKSVNGGIELRRSGGQRAGD